LVQNQPRATASLDRRASG